MCRWKKRRCRERDRPRCPCLSPPRAVSRGRRGDARCTGRAFRASWRSREESALSVEASLQEQAVPVGVPASESTRALNHHDRGGADGFAGGRRHEVTRQLVDEAADFPVKPLVVAEQDAQEPGQHPNQLPVVKPQQELLVHVLAPSAASRWRPAISRMAAGDRLRTLPRGSPPGERLRRRPSYQPRRRRAIASAVTAPRERGLEYTAAGLHRPAMRSAVHSACSSPASSRGDTLPAAEALGNVPGRSAPADRTPRQTAGARAPGTAPRPIRPILLLRCGQSMVQYRGIK